MKKWSLDQARIEKDDVDTMADDYEVRHKWN